MRMQRPVEAHPRTPDEVARLPICPDVVVAATRRSVKEVLHFTTLRGVVGVLAAGAVKSRKRLSHDQYLEHVYRPNAPIRKDPEWIDYVNLSVARINAWMFEHSERWHAQESNPWAVLSFHPGILGHPGVVFATTNNVYPACRRAEGRDGFDQLFADQVYGRYNRRHDRVGKPADWPTDRQAEVLYPGELSCAHLQRIDVQMEDATDTIHGILAGVNSDVRVCYAPEVFV